MIKEYKIKSTGKNHVKEYQRAAETINVAAKSISENLKWRPKAGENLIPSSKVKERGRGHSKLSNHGYGTFNSHQNRTIDPKAQLFQQYCIEAPRATLHSF